VAAGDADLSTDSPALQPQEQTLWCIIQHLEQPYCASTAHSNGGIGFGMCFSCLQAWIFILHHTCPGKATGVDECVVYAINGEHAVVSKTRLSSSAHQYGMSIEWSFWSWYWCCVPIPVLSVWGRWHLYLGVFAYMSQAVLFVLQLVNHLCVILCCLCNAADAASAMHCSWGQQHCPGCGGHAQQPGAHEVPEAFVQSSIRKPIANRQKLNWRRRFGAGDYLPACQQRLSSIDHDNQAV